MKSEFIFDRAPFRFCHASRICESDGALLAAWFGGTREKGLDVEFGFRATMAKAGLNPTDLQISCPLCGLPKPEKPANQSAAN